MATENRHADVGAIVADARERAGLTQAQVAEAMRQVDEDHKWSQATVWSVEKGKRPLQVVESQDLATVLGLGSMYIMDQSPSARAIANHVMLHHEAHEVRAHFQADVQRLSAAMGKRIEMSSALIARLEDSGDETPNRLQNLKAKLENTRTIKSHLEDLASHAWWGHHG